MLLGVVLIGVILIKGISKEGSSTSKDFIGKIFPGSEIKTQENPYRYKIASKDYFIKKVSIGTHDFLVIFRNQTSYSSTYSIYNFGNPTRLIQIDSIPASVAEEALSKYLQIKDITGDGLAEFIFKIFTTGKGQNAYNILRLKNDSNLEIMTIGEWSTENKSDIIMFDTIKYKNQNVVITVHDLDVRSMLSYKIEGNSLIPSTSITFKLTDRTKGDEYEITRTIKNQEPQVIGTKKGNIWIDSFEPYE